jgi:TRAP-type transport system periplasmic protein
MTCAFAGVLAATLAAPPAPAAETFRVTVATGHPATFLWVAVIRDHFIPEVDRLLEDAGGNYRIDWNEAYATLVRPGGELDAVRTGVTDMAFVITLFVEPQMPLQNVTYVTPFVTDDVLLMTRVMTEMHDEIPALRQTWDNHDQVYLDGASVDTYHIISSFPVDSLNDLQGRKIGTQGPSALWFLNSGATTVASTLAERYNNLQTGVYEAGVGFITGTYPPRIHEVAPYVIEMNFGAMFVGGLSVNMDVWDGFPEEVQEAFRTAATSYRDEFARRQDENVERFTEAMKEDGATFIPVSQEERREWAQRLPNIAAEWADRMEAMGLPGRLVLETYMEKMRESGAEVLRDWDRE